MGYRGDLGYHQLLYPNANDTRQLLNWLTSKLPRNVEEDDDQTAVEGQNSSDILRQAIASRIAALQKLVRTPLLFLHSLSVSVSLPLALSLCLSLTPSLPLSRYLYLSLSSRLSLASLIVLSLSQFSCHALAFCLSLSLLDSRPLLSGLCPRSTLS